jgi:hypothetical protein
MSILSTVKTNIYLQKPGNGLMGKKATAWRVFRAFRTQESLESYKKVALKCKTAIKKLTADYENRLISSGNL